MKGHYYSRSLFWYTVSNQNWTVGTNIVSDVSGPLAPPNGPHVMLAAVLWRGWW